MSITQENGNTVRQIDTENTSDEEAHNQILQIPFSSTQEYRIPCYQVDRDERLKTEAYFQILQDALDLYAAERNIGREYTKNHDLTWIIRNHDVQINEAPKWNDKIIVDSHSSDLRRSTLMFSSRAYSEDRKKLLFSSTSQLVLLSTLNCRPVMVKENLPHLQVWDAEKKPAFEAIQEPEHVDAEQQREVISDNIDFNHHCNNVNYVRFANVAVPDDFRKDKELVQVRIQYKVPAVLGDKLTVQTQVDERETRHKIISSQNKGLEYARIQMKWRER